MDAGLETKYFVTLFFSLLCIVFCIKIAIQIRQTFPARVNCWFCNNNLWVKYSLSNSWVCRKCDQYNGFSKDGDYNKPLNAHITSPIYFNKIRSHFSPANNGLCYKCNTNQQLKVMQLSSFQPMNENNFANEVDAFKLHLEKIYQLCSLCKKYVKDKLQKEKGHFLGTKLIHSRTDKKSPDHLKNGFSFVKKLTMKVLRVTALVLLVCILTDVYLNIDLFLSKKIIKDSKKHFDNLHSQLKNFSQSNIDYLHSVCNLTESYSSMIPSFMYGVYNSTLCYFHLDKENNVKLYELLQIEHIGLDHIIETLPLAGCTMQFLLRISDINVSLRYFINDISWMLSVYISRNANKLTHPLQIITTLLIILYPMTTDSQTTKVFKKTLIKKMKNLSDSSLSSVHDDDDLISEESDNDVRSSTPIYSQARDITPPWMSSNCSPGRDNSNYAKSMSSNPSSFIGSLYSGNTRNTGDNFNNVSYFSSPSSVTSNTGVFQRKYESNELNNSISGLHLGKQNGKMKNNDFVFSTRQYECTSPSLFMPSSAHTAARPILSPSRFTHSTQQSWVAGGYWGAESPRQIFNLRDTSRSSSQSSGFESLSSAHHRNVNAIPLLHDDTLTSDYNRKNDNNFNYSNNLYVNTNLGSNSAFQSFQPKSHVPIYPNVQNHNSVFIPNSMSYNFQSNHGVHSPNNTFLAASNPDHSFKPLHKPAFSE